MSDVDTTKVVLWALCAGDGKPTECQGQFLAGIDYEACDGMGVACFKPSWESALTFDSPREAYEFIDRVSPVRPTIDGQDYRPLRTWVYGAAPIGVLLMMESQTATKQ